MLVGSGDDDRGASSQTAAGNTAGTKDTSFIAFGYVNTGLALAPELSNLVSFRLTGSAFPLRGQCHHADSPAGRVLPALEFVPIRIADMFLRMGTAWPVVARNVRPFKVEAGDRFRQCCVGFDRPA